MKKYLKINERNILEIDDNGRQPHIIDIIKQTEKEQRVKSKEQCK